MIASVNKKLAVSIKFRLRTGEKLNLNNPKSFNEKLQWLKFYWRDPIAPLYADKYEVRKIVEKRIGKEVLNEVYGVYETVEEININKLPDSFVLKATHGSGWNILCENKRKINWDVELKKIKKWLKTNYYWHNLEWVYKYMKPRIICEKYITDENGIPPMDYKFFCFNGEPKLIQVDIDRFGYHRQNFFDTQWNFLDMEIYCDNDKDFHIPKPKRLKEMIEYSKELSKGFPHVRVDLYSMGDQVIFGELTYFHMSGMAKFRKKELDLEMGSWIQLTKGGSKGWKQVELN